MKLATTILQLLASILLFSKTLTPTSPYTQHSCLGRLLDSSWHLPIPVPLAKFPWDDMPTSLRSSTITAATTTNITLPDPNEVSYGIYLLVDLGNSSSFNVNDTALLNTTVLPALSPVALPAGSFSFECKYILALLLFASVLILLILWQIVESSFQDDFGDDVLDSSENFDYAFLYGIDDDEENLDDDSLCYSVSTCASDDLNSVLSILDDNDLSSDLFIASDCRVILPAVVECALPKMRRSLRIAAMPAVSYKKFY